MFLDIVKLIATNSKVEKHVPKSILEFAFTSNVCDKSDGWNSPLRQFPHWSLYWNAHFRQTIKTHFPSTCQTTLIRDKYPSESFVVAWRRSQIIIRNWHFGDDISIECHARRGSVRALSHDEMISGILKFSFISNQFGCVTINLMNGSVTTDLIQLFFETFSNECKYWLSKY